MENSTRSDKTIGRKNMAQRYQTERNWGKYVVMCRKVILLQMARHTLMPPLFCVELGKFGIVIIIAFDLHGDGCPSIKKHATKI